MESKRRLMKKDNRFNLVKAVFNFCFFISLFLSANHAIAFSNNQTQEDDISLEDAYVTLSFDFYNSSQNPVHYPLDPEPNGPEYPDEKETKEDTDDEFSRWTFNSLSWELTKYNSAKSTFLNFASSVQNRKSLPLFVLHHCWKNFLL